MGAGGVEWAEMLQPELFQFLRELKENNQREWFQAHKPRFERDVKGPLLALIESLAPAIEAVSPHLVCDATSMFRIHRDVRFSADKSPYKTHVAAQFRHEEGKDVHTPGFYLHLEPGNVLAGAGIWHPDNRTLGQIRQAIEHRPQAWREARTVGPLGGDSLKRPPKGYAADHPLVDDLRRKDFVVMVNYSEEQALQPDFGGRFAADCRNWSPLMAFLCQAVGVPF